MSHEGYSSTISDFSIISQENNGAMGDIVPIESSMFFADDECDNSSMIAFPRRENACIRCRAALETRARVCRTCYNIRRTWMPVKPTRKLRQKRRPSFRQRLISSRRVALKTRESSSGLFPTTNKPLTDMTLNRINISSESSSDFKKGREAEWKDRRLMKQYKQIPGSVSKKTTKHGNIEQTDGNDFDS